MMLRLIQSRLSSACALLLLTTLMALDASAQADARQDSSPVARLFDEYSMVGGCDHSARLDNFAVQLMNETSATGYIVAYGPEGEGSGTGEYRLRVSLDYLVNTRGLDPARVKTVYGGRYKNKEEVVTELWVVPPDAEPPELKKYENDTKTFRGLYTEYDSTDATYPYYGDEGTGPPSGNALFANFADTLRQQPETIAYIVVSSSPEAAPGAWRRQAKELSSTFENAYKVEASRIKIICGGYTAQAREDMNIHVQLWIVPADAPPPVAEVKQPEPRPARAVMLAAASDYQLSYENDAKQVFEGFADVLKTDEELSACIIVRTPAEKEKTDEEKLEEAKQEKEVIDLPRADMVALVEKWKTDLEEKYGLSRNRLTIVIAPSEDESQSGTLETWVVPRGAQLPNAYAVEEEMIETGEVITNEEMTEQATTEEVGAEAKSIPPEE